jgi:6-phosphogluconolactonase (cycloisomerase 2 family)
MLNRRRVMGLLAALPAGGVFREAWGQSGRVPYFHATGPELFVHQLDVRAATLSPIGAVTLPRNVQYAWAHPSGRLLYVAASDGGPGVAGTSHSVTTFRVDPASFMLTAAGILRLASRPLHLSVDNDGRFLLLAYNNPSHVTVHPIGGDGLPGAALPQPEGLDFGIYTHQVRMTPSGRSLAVVTRGNDAAAGRPEDPGAIKLFRFDNGRLSNLGSFAPGGNGLGFGPRHLDFHAGANVAAVGLERQNALVIYGLTADGSFSREPLFHLNTLRDPDGKARHPGQGVGPIHFHPNGRFVYLANRGSGVIEVDGRRISNGGENSIAVFALNPRTGEPRHIQSIDARGFENRTFVIDAGGTLLIAASQTSLALPDGRMVRAGLAFFRIGADGRLTFLRKQEVDVSKGTQFWSGLLTMA